MKVINYGPKYKPSTLICTSCQSELEYDMRDIEFRTHRVIERATLKPKQIVGSYVDCPVCSHMNVLEEKEFPYTLEEPPKKRKWFSRKEN
jgi:hypothetical protein